MRKKDLPLSYIELSKRNLIHNFKQFKNLAKRGTKFSVAIKGNAYGHGLSQIVKVLEPYVDFFQIDSVEELELLRKISRKKALLLGYVQKSDLEKAMRLGCILSFFSLEQLSTISTIAKNVDVIQEVHIPIDAYLGREGFLINELPKLFKEIKNYKNVNFSGLYAHFANIEDTRDFSHAQKQIEEFKKAVKLADDFGLKKLETHISATSGLLMYEKNLGIHPIVRLGIGVYGMWPSDDIRKIYENKIKIKPVLSWKTKIAQVRILPKGSTIGYGLTYTTKKETKIAIIPQGYADGFYRDFSNKGEVLIGGTRCKVLGRVSMNMFAVNVSHLPKVKIEEEVVILGRQDGQEIIAEELALKFGTINYEITTRISSLLPRIIF